MNAPVKRAARRAESHPALRVFARGGFAANGILHILVGSIALTVALGGRGDSDQTGALRTIAEAPLGVVVLWALAALLGALGLWHALEGVLAREPRDASHGRAAKWGRRASEWGQAIVFLALGALSASVALGARPDGERTAEGASRDLLEIPGGPVLLAAVGLGVGVAGVAFVAMGIRRSFRKKMRLPSGAPGHAIAALGAVGFIAKGIALGVVGILLLIAVITGDAATAGGLDGAIIALRELPFGPWLVATVGAGLVVYGVFCLFRARYARL